jgi:hypothetical protein
MDVEAKTFEAIALLLRLHHNEAVPYGFGTAALKKLPVLKIKSVCGFE